MGLRGCKNGLQIDLLRYSTTQSLLACGALLKLAVRWILRSTSPINIR
jgi:hypothetical protein